MPVPEQQYNYDVMAIGAHPDDVEHAIGGTLLHLRDQGKSICIVHMTHGEAGTFGSKDKRDQEARTAAEYIGADVRWLDFQDTRIEDSYEARIRMITAIRDIRPRVILAQYYEFPIMHHDHESTGRIVRNSFRMCRFKNVDTGNAPFWIPNVAYYLLPPQVKPSFVIDVSHVHDRWLELAGKYDSQYDAIPGYKDRLLGHKRQAGFQVDTQYGEAFYCDRPLIANKADITVF
jgi:LmbE family N-acetylglucosaminyl deacetylase